MFDVSYIGDTKDAKTAQTPPGFKITPNDAVEIMAHDRRRKMADNYYFDESNYYVLNQDRGSIARSLRGTVPQEAIDRGVIINGKTGEVFDREKQVWLADPRVTPEDTGISDPGFDLLFENSSLQ